MAGNILMTVITPHPPIIIPEIGKGNLEKVKKTVKAFEKLADEIVKLNPDTIFIVTPHSALHPYFFSIYSEEKLTVNFANFGAPQVSIEFDNDIEFVKELNNQIKENFNKLNFLPAGTPLDHGSGVPLYYLAKAGYKNKIAVINYTALGKKEHKLFGEKIVKTAEKISRKIVFTASGDLSHKLIPGAPAGYDKDAYKFDDLIVEKINKGDYKSIEDISSDMRATAGECGYNSLMIAFGVVGGKPEKNEVLSYEAPFGVGYLVGTL